MHSCIYAYINICIYARCLSTVLGRAPERVPKRALGRTLGHGAWARRWGVPTCIDGGDAGRDPPSMQALFRGPNKHGLWEKCVLQYL